MKGASRWLEATAPPGAVRVRTARAAAVNLFSVNLFSFWAVMDGLLVFRGWRSQLGEEREGGPGLGARDGQQRLAVEGQGPPRDQAVEDLVRVAHPPPGHLLRRELTHRHRGPTGGGTGGAERGADGAGQHLAHAL